MLGVGRARLPNDHFHSTNPGVHHHTLEPRVVEVPSSNLQTNPPFYPDGMSSSQPLPQAIQLKKGKAGYLPGLLCVRSPQVEGEFDGAIDLGHALVREHGNAPQDL